MAPWVFHNVPGRVPQHFWDLVTPGASYVKSKQLLAAVGASCSLNINVVFSTYTVNTYQLAVPVTAYRWVGESIFVSLVFEDIAHFPCSKDKVWHK